MEVSPFTAFNAAKALDPWNKQGGLMPKRKPDPPGTGWLGRTLHEVNYLIDLLTDNCNVEPWILATTALPAAISAAWSIALPDLKEAYHQVIGDSLVCSLKQEIRDGHEFGNKFYDGGLRTLFKAAEISDLAAWRFFIFSTVIDGLIDWQSLAQEAEGCRGPRSGDNSSAPFGAIPALGRPVLSGAFEWVHQDGKIGGFTVDCIINPHQEGYILWCAECHAAGSDQSLPMEFFITDTESNTEVFRAKSITDKDGFAHPIVAYHKPPILAERSQHLVGTAFCTVACPGDQAFAKRGYCVMQGSVLP